MRRRLLMLALGAIACNGTYEVESGEHCRQAGYSIAARLEACTGDQDRANAAYEAFARRYTCLGNAEKSDSYGCAIDLNATRCSEVEAWGDDLDRWISETPRCHAVIGGWAPSLPPDTKACAPLAEALAPKMAACSPSSLDIVKLTADVQVKLAETGCLPGSTDACKAELTALDCSASSVPGDPLTWLALAPACSALQVKP